MCIGGKRDYRFLLKNEQDKCAGVSACMSGKKLEERKSCELQMGNNFLVEVMQEVYL